MVRFAHAHKNHSQKSHWPRRLQAVNRLGVEGLGVEGLGVGSGFGSTGFLKVLGFLVLGFGASSLCRVYGFGVALQVCGAVLVQVHDQLAELVASLRPCRASLGRGAGSLPFSPRSTLCRLERCGFAGLGHYQPLNNETRAFGAMNL